MVASVTMANVLPSHMEGTKTCAKFKGDDEWLLDRMVEASGIHPKERLPGYGRKLVPFFSSDTGAEAGEPLEGPARPARRTEQKGFAQRKQHQHQSATSSSGDSGPPSPADRKQNKKKPRSPRRNNNNSSSSGSHPSSSASTSPSSPSSGSASNSSSSSPRRHHRRHRNNNNVNNNKNGLNSNNAINNRSSSSSPRKQQHSRSIHGGGRRARGTQQQQQQQQQQNGGGGGDNSSSSSSPRSSSSSSSGSGGVSGAQTRSHLAAKRAIGAGNAALAAAASCVGRVGLPKRSCGACSGKAFVAESAFAGPGYLLSPPPEALPMPTAFLLSCAMAQVVN